MSPPKGWTPATKSSGEASKFRLFFQDADGNIQFCNAFGSDSFNHDPMQDESRDFFSWQGCSFWHSGVTSPMSAGGRVAHCYRRQGENGAVLGSGVRQQRVIGWSCGTAMKTNISYVRKLEHVTTQVQCLQQFGGLQWLVYAFRLSWDASSCLYKVWQKRHKFSSASGDASESSLVFYARFIAIVLLAVPFEWNLGCFCSKMLRLCQTRIAETGQGFVMQKLMQLQFLILIWSNLDR